ncbi:MAG: phosphoglucosamine mutase [Lachnospiraceae bacterium]|nr:phosphoglucosamine mutase [Lachnospiraceae bacterium]
MGKYFGTDGFRGEANVTLKSDHAFLIGRFLGWHYARNHENGQANIVIGKDTRLSSYMFESALAAGITSSGSNAYLMHVTTTPSVSYAVRTGDFDCGIMISASHNPYYDNGIKILNAEGRKIEANVEKMLEAYIDGIFGDIPRAQREKIGHIVDYAQGRNKYLGYLTSIPAHSFRGMKVGLDCANGASFAMAKGLFEILGAKTFVINATPTGVNINDHCGSTHPEELKKLVLEKSLDVGFAMDGDADRCIAIDEKGNEVNGDLIMYACGRYLMEKGELASDTIVTTVMSNLGLYKACEAAGMKTEQTQVGDKYVAENMNANGYSLGGEQSGHIIFSRYAATGDGLLTALMVMEAMLTRNAPLSYLTQPVKIYPQVLVNVRVKDKNKARENEKMKAAVAAVDEQLNGNGRILVRESGTEPLIRIMVEAETDELCRSLADSVAVVLKEEGLTADS